MPKHKMKPELIKALNELGEGILSLDKQTEQKRKKIKISKILKKLFANREKQKKAAIEHTITTIQIKLTAIENILDEEPNSDSKTQALTEIGEIRDLMRQKNDTINNELAKDLEVKYIALTRPLKNEKEPTPTTTLLNDIEWMAARLIANAQSKQLHSDLYEYIPAFRIEFLKAAHNNNSEEGNQQLQLLADRLKLKMINFKLIADGEFNNQHQLENVDNETPQTTRINNYLNNITQDRQLKSASDKEMDKEAIGIALARGDDQLFSDLLKDKNTNLSFNFDEASGNNLLHELLKRDLTQDKNKNMLKALLKHPKTKNIINESNHNGEHALQQVLQMEDPDMQKEIANALFEKGASLDKKDREGFTPKNPLSALSKQEQIDLKNAYNEIVNEASDSTKKLLAENINTIQASIAINGKEHVLANINILDNPQENTNQKAKAKRTLALLDSEELNPTVAHVNIDLKKLESQVESINQTLLNAYDQLIQVKRYLEIPKEHDKFDKPHRELNDCIKKLEALQNETYSLSTPSGDVIAQYEYQIKVLGGLKNNVEHLINNSKGTPRDEYTDIKIDVRNIQVSHFNEIAAKVNEMHENGEYQANLKAWKTLSNYCKTHIADIAKAAGFSSQTGLDIKPTREQLEASVYKVGQPGPEGKNIETPEELESIVKEELRSHRQNRWIQFENNLEEANTQLGTLEAKDDKVSKEIEQQVLKEAQPMSQTRPPYFKEFLLDFTKLSNEKQAEAILEKVKDLTQDDKERVVGITYSANHDQAETIRSAYAKGEWMTGTKGANQAAVIAKVESLLETEEYKSLQSNFRILPVSTMAHSGGNGETKDAWLEEDLKSINEFVTNGGHVLGWQNQHTKGSEQLVAIGGGIAKKNNTLSDEQSGLVQLYFQTLKESSEQKLEPPGVEFEVGDIILSNKKTPEKAAPEAVAPAPNFPIDIATEHSQKLHDKATKAASFLDKAKTQFKIAKDELAKAKDEEQSPADRHKALEAAKSAFEAASEAGQNAMETTAAAESAYAEARKVTLPDDASEKDKNELKEIKNQAEMASKTAIANKKTINQLDTNAKELSSDISNLELPPKPKEAKEAKEKDLTPEDIKIARHVHEQLKHYRRRINYFRSQIEVAARQQDSKKYEKIIGAALDLQEQLKIYQKYINNPSAHPDSIMDKVKNFFSPVDFSKNNPIIDKYLERLTEITGTKKQEDIAYFSQKSEVVKAEDPAKLQEAIQQKINEMISHGVKMNGGLEAGPTIKTTQSFENAARINYSRVDDIHAISVQRMKDKNTYVSEFSFQPASQSASFGWPQGLPGRSIPKDAVLKWAIDEVQNFLAGAPDQSQPIRIVGNMDAKCVEALILYCKHKKIPYHNATAHHPTVKDRHMQHYAERLDKHPERFAEVPKLHKKTTKEEWNKAVKTPWATLKDESDERKIAAKTTHPVKPGGGR